MKSQDLEKLIVLEKLSALAGLRTFLCNLRMNDTSRAIASMEFTIDCLVPSVVDAVKNCDVTIKELVDGELNRLSEYRNNNKEDFSAYLAQIDEGERGFCLEIRSKVEGILANYQK